MDKKKLERMARGYVDAEKVEAKPEGQEKCPACKVTLPEGWSVNNRGHKVEHVCKHGVGHTCAASTDDTTHGCDGCCAPRGES